MMPTIAWFIYEVKGEQYGFVFDPEDPTPVGDTLLRYAMDPDLNMTFDDAMQAAQEIEAMSTVGEDQ